MVLETIRVIRDLPILNLQKDTKISCDFPVVESQFSLNIGTRHSVTSYRLVRNPHNQKEEGKMKGLPAILIGLLAYFFVGVSIGSGQMIYGLMPTAIATGTPPPGVVETYKVVNGMSIRAVVYNPGGGSTHRVAIVIHGGGYSS